MTALSSIGPSAAAPVRTDAFTDFLNSIHVTIGPFRGVSAPVALAIGLVMLGILIFGLVQVLLGIGRGGWKGKGRRDGMLDAREQLQVGIVAIVATPFVPFIVAGLYKAFSALAGSSGG